MFADIKLYRQFFDRKPVIDFVGQKRVKSLSRLGAFIRRRAQQSMKRSPRRRNPTKGRKRRSDAQMYSAPGEPPKYFEGSLKRFLFFVWDKETESMVVGPAIKNSVKKDAGGRGVPALMEYGGVVVRNGVRIVYEPRPFMEPAYEHEMRNAMTHWERD